jgi:beta-lactamase regulating signal transducer with metallopeptidase domain
MSTAWMVTYVLVGALLLAVAFAADAVLAQARYPRRLGWFGAMLAMCILPWLLSAVSAPLLSARAARALRLTTPASEGTVAASAGQTESAVGPALDAAPIVNRGVGKSRFAMEPRSSPRIDAIAQLLCLVSVLGCAALLFTAWRRLAIARRDWRQAPDEIAHTVRALTGEPTRVWCSSAIGPAALGARRPEIVIPQWVMELQESDRALVLRHEASHVLARDPMLLQVALALVVLMPWNLALLVAYRRLHRAVEHDCDARVLAASGEARAYARLLIHTAERQMSRAVRGWARASRWLPAPVPGIGSRSTELEARLRAMMPQAPTWRSRVRLLSAGVVVTLGLAAACSVPTPERARRDSIQQAGTRTSGADLTLNSRDLPAVPTSQVDSVRRYERMLATMEQLQPRGSALIDSLVTSAAMQSVPSAFDAAQANNEFVWLLLDENYRVIRTNRGKQFYSMLVTRADGTDTVVPVANIADRVRLSFGKREIQRAFPGVRAEQIGMWSSIDAPIGNRMTRIVWARFLSGVTDTSSELPTRGAVPRDTQ